MNKFVRYKNTTINMNEIQIFNIDNRLSRRDIQISKGSIHQIMVFKTEELAQKAYDLIFDFLEDDRYSTLNLTDWVEKWEKELT